ncbi:MAG: hypothetical protein Q8O40_00325 [Chloroflexota bacterium]|nr:hypothetical protein [Chloroflexota bacterium]
MTTICKLCKKVLGVDADEAVEWIVCHECQQETDLHGRDLLAWATSPYSDGFTRESMSGDIVRCPICGEAWAVDIESGEALRPCPECLRDYTIVQVSGKFKAFDSTGEEVLLPIKRRRSQR